MHRRDFLSKYTETTFRVYPDILRILSPRAVGGAKTSIILINHSLSLSIISIPCLLDVLKMAQLVKSPVKRKGSPNTPDEDPETPVSTLSSNVAGSDKGYYGDEEPSSYDGEQVEVLLIEEAEGGRVHSVRQRKSKWTRDVERV